MHQVYELALGVVRDGMFFRTGGYGAHLGDGAPLCKLVVVRPAPKLGRPKGKKQYPPRRAVRRAPARQWAYALDIGGNWWSIQILANGHARARTVSAPPYKHLGIRRVGWLPTLAHTARTELAAAQATWQALQDAAHIEQLRQRCPLV